MCGLVALIGPVPRTVARAAIAGASARGPHQHAWAARSGRSWHVSAAHGPIAGLPSTTAPVVVGHSRLATSGARPGDTPPLAEAQPYVDGPHLVAHNGTLPGAPDGTVDTRLILVALTGPAGQEAARTLLDTAGHPSATILAGPAGPLLAYRADGATVPAHPLHVASGPGWAAASSAPLPAGHLVPISTLTEVTPA